MRRFLFDRRFWIGCLTGGLIGFVIQIARLLLDPRVTAADRLAFYGALLGSAVGAGLAVLGAVYIDDRRRNHDRNEHRGLLRDALTELLEKLRPVADRTPQLPEAQLDFARQEIIELIRGVRDAIALLELASQSAKLSDFKELQALHIVRRQLENTSPIFEREARVVEGFRPSLGIVRVFYQNAQPAAEALVAPVESAIFLLDR